MIEDLISQLTDALEALRQEIASLRSHMAVQAETRQPPTVEPDGIAPAEKVALSGYSRSGAPIADLAEQVEGRVVFADKPGVLPLAALETTADLSVFSGGVSFGASDRPFSLLVRLSRNASSLPFAYALRFDPAAGTVQFKKLWKDTRFYDVGPVHDLPESSTGRWSFDFNITVRDSLDGDSVSLVGDLTDDLGRYDLQGLDTKNLLSVGGTAGIYSE